MATKFNNPWAAKNADVLKTSVLDTDAVDKEDEDSIEKQWESEDKKAKSKPKEDKYKGFIEKGDYVYTCKAGWIDKRHFSTPSKRPFIGSKGLWDQILDETGEKSISTSTNGYKVTYRQDAKVIRYLPTIGTTKHYFVKKGLSLKEKEEVALAIFQEVSMEFEDFQGYASMWSGSSFDPADLVSNLLGFYYVVRNYFDYEIFELCGELTKEQSLEIYMQYPGTFTDKKYKNKKFTPRYFPNKYCNGNPTFPKEFQEIKVAKKGVNFRNWSIHVDEKYENNQD